MYSWCVALRRYDIMYLQSHHLRFWVWNGLASVASPSLQILLDYPLKGISYIRDMNRTIMNNSENSIELIFEERRDRLLLNTLINSRKVAEKWSKQRKSMCQVLHTHSLPDWMHRQLWTAQINRSDASSSADNRANCRSTSTVIPNHKLLYWWQARLSCQFTYD